MAENIKRNNYSIDIPFFWSHNYGRWDNGCQRAPIRLVRDTTYSTGFFNFLLCAWSCQKSKLIFISTFCGHNINIFVTN